MIVFALIIALLQAADPAATIATAAVAAVPVSPTCSVLSPVTDAVGASPAALLDVEVVCGSTGVGLGRALSYRSAYNIQSQTLVVELTGGTGKRVILVTLGEIGVLRVVDLTRELTGLTGIYDEAPLESPVDLTSFPVDGNIAVQARAPAPAVQGKAIITASKNAGGTDEALRTTTVRLDLKIYGVAAPSSAVTSSDKVDDREVQPAAAPGG